MAFAELKPKPKLGPMHREKGAVPHTREYLLVLGTRR
jgi:hypothetical protein